MDHDLLEFTGTPATILAEAESLVRLSRQQRDELVRDVQPHEATFDKVVTPLAYMEGHFTSKSNVLTFYRHVVTDKDIRDASAQAQKLCDDFHMECWLREDLFRLVDYVYHIPNAKEQAPSEESWLFLERLYNNYIHNGLGIRDQASRDHFKAIRKRLSEIHGEFRENLNQSSDGIWLTEDELAGVPERMIAQMERSTESANMLKIDPNDPVHMDIPLYATSGETRKKIFIAIENRCDSNAPLLKEAIRLRFQLAKILGFSTYASLQLQVQNRMAKTPDRVNEFLSKLQSKLTPPALAMLRRLEDLKKEDVVASDGKGPADHRIFHWDYAFYRAKFSESRLPAIRGRSMEYFPLQTTTQATILLFSDIFGLKFNKVDTPGAGCLWHPDVQLYAVHENEKRGSGFLGYFYLDLYYRQGKYPQASCFSLQPGFVREDGSRQHPSTALLCAFSKPTQDKPTILGHFDVVLMLHEMGHGIHDLVSKTRYSHFHGPEGVPVDFGEMPSQMLEHWCWIPAHIKSLSCHYSYLSPEMLFKWKQKDENENQPQPERQIPDELINIMIRSSRLVFGPLFQLEQLHRAVFDMAIHQFSNEQDIDDLDLNVLWNKTRKEVGLVDGLEVFGGDYTQGHSYTTFSHLVNHDYTAGYYAYLYSKVFAADAFYTAFDGDELDPESGIRWRRIVLEPGGSKDGMKILTEFLGREPMVDAFYTSLLSNDF